MLKTDLNNHTFKIIVAYIIQKKKYDKLTRECIHTVHVYVKRDCHVLIGTCMTKVEWAIKQNFEEAGR